MYAASRIVNLDETFLLAALRGLRLVWFKSVRISFSLLTSFAGKCRLPDLNRGQLDLQSSALPV